MQSVGKQIAKEKSEVNKMESEKRFLTILWLPQEGLHLFMVTMLQSFSAYGVYLMLGI